MTVAVEARDVFRVYSTPEGDAAALQGLSLAVQEREITAIVGPSGAGKTTFLRMLAALDRPSAGTITAFGLDLGNASDRARSRYRARALGYLDQHYSRALAPELSARELVALRLLARGEGRSSAHRRADELLDRVALGNRPDAVPAELSGGEQQRVAVCAALAHRPRLLLCDEPTGELDAANARVIYELIAELARAEGCTVVIVSHDAAASEIADRTIRIRDGRVSEEATRATGGQAAIVVGRGGWLRLPEELLHRAGIASRASARLEDGHIRVEPADGAAAPRGPLRGTPDGAVSPVDRDRDPSRAGTTVAEVAALTKVYGTGRGATRALDAVSAAFDGGRLYVVTGPSGSGKSTFLHLVAGLDLPNSGAVSVLGVPITTLDREARARFRAEHVGFVSQAVGLVPFLSARENVEIGLALRRGARASDGETALDALAAVGLTERSEQRAGRLSRGEQVRAAVARAVAARPALLVLDEPTARLDQANAIAVALLLASLARDTGAAVVCATHDPVVVDQADEELALGVPMLPARVAREGVRSERGE